MSSIPHFRPQFRSCRIRRAITACLLALAAGIGAGASAANAAAAELYTSQLSSLRSAPDNGSDIASISPGVALHVVKSSARSVEVEITGWSPEGGEAYLFRKIGERILLAHLSAGGMAARKVVASKRDYYETLWQQVRLTGWIESSKTAADPETVWSGASALFHKRCTRCHALHRPTEFKANQWPSILKIMSVRAGLSPAQKALVTQYLQTHAKGQHLAEPTGGGAAATAKIIGDRKLAAAGAQAYANGNCAACHGARGASPASTSYPKLAGQNADYVYKQLRDFQTGARDNDEDHIMKDTIASIPDDNLRAISYWLSTLK